MCEHTLCTGPLLFFGISPPPPVSRARYGPARYTCMLRVHSQFQSQLSSSSSHGSISSFPPDKACLGLFSNMACTPDRHPSGWQSVGGFPLHKPAQRTKSSYRLFICKSSMSCLESKCCITLSCFCSRAYIEGTERLSECTCE